MLLLFEMIRPPPRSTLSPYTSLLRSLEERLQHSQRAPRQFDHAASDIARLEAPPRPRFHGKRVGLFALVGSGIGTLADVMIPVARGGRPVFDAGFADQT